MTLKTTVIALPLLVAGTFVSAQEVRYLGYGAEYLSTDAVDLLSLGGSLDYTNDRFIFNGGASYIDADGGDLTQLNFRLGYVINPSIVAYGGVAFNDSDGGDFAIYSIGGEYGAGPITAGLTFSQSDVDGTDSGVAVYGGYKFSEFHEVALVVGDDGFGSSTTLLSDYDTGGTELFALFNDAGGVSTFAVTGAYDLGNQFRVGASYVSIDVGADTASLFSVSGGYEISDNLWVDLGIGDADAAGDLISLGITFETGRETLLVDRIETATFDALGAFGGLF